MPTTVESSQHVIEIARQAAAANRGTAGRRGNVVVIDPEAADEVMITADVHGHRLNFNKLCRIAALADHPRRHLVMQEVCHGGPKYPDSNGCMSHLLLEDVAALKVAFPDRFHFILSNHEMAELMDYPIAKGGQLLNMQMRNGLQTMYGDAAMAVRDALHEFLRTCPLAVRPSPEVFVCHGSPDRVAEDGFDTSIFQRPLTTADMLPGGTAFRLVWGRDFRKINADALAAVVRANILIHGHEPCDEGYRTPNNRQIILDCCRDAAGYLMLPITEKLTHAQLAALIRTL